MKRILCPVFFLLFAIPGYCQTNDGATLKAGLNNARIRLKTSFGAVDANAIIWIPANYNKDKKYPLIIYSHDNTEAGDDINALYTSALPEVLVDGFKPGFDCIIICPQATSTNVQPSWLPALLDFAGDKFNIDKSRIYITGVAKGGHLCYGSQLSISPEVAKKIAAICVLSGSTKEVNQSNIDWWVKSKTPIWSINGEKDDAAIHENIFFVSALNKKVENLAKFSVRKGVGHADWKDVYNGTYRDNGVNIWDWLYSNSLDKNKTLSTSKGRRITLTATDKQVYCPNVESTYNPQPGDTLVIPTGIISFLIHGFNGTKLNPIVVIPEDSGWIGGYPAYSGNVSQATYFKMSGFHINGQNNTNFGLVVGNESSDYEISHCYIKNIASIGLCAKHNPDPEKPDKNWPDFVIRNVIIHDITVKNTGTEALYIGYTFDVIKPLAPPFDNLSIYNITTDSSGWDGVQLSNCQNVSMHHIKISHYGLRNARGQQAGLLLGGMVTLKNPLINVTVSNGTGAGILIFGRGKMYIRDANLTQVGTSKGENAVFVSDYVDFGYNLKPLQLHLKNIKVNGSAGSAMVIVNSNKSMLPGTVENFVYTKTTGGIIDNVNTISK